MNADVVTLLLLLLMAAIALLMLLGIAYLVGGMHGVRYAVSETRAKGYFCAYGCRWRAVLCKPGDHVAPQPYGEPR